MAHCGTNRGGRAALHRGQNRREGLRNSEWASVPASAPGEKAGAAPARRSVGLGPRAPNPPCALTAGRATRREHKRGARRSRAGARANNCPNQNWFLNVSGAKRILGAWRGDHNHDRPHTALGRAHPGRGRFCDDRAPVAYGALRPVIACFARPRAGAKSGGTRVMIGPESGRTSA
ncbi:MAG: integrase core domain-containing protein [Terriglobia bacterium]